jgi:hypothetical protein
MAKHIWSVLCERISVDQRTNLVSYLSCIEGIRALELPFAVPNLSLGTLWLTDNKKAEKIVFRLVLGCPDSTEKVLVEGSQEQAPSARARINLILDGLAVDQTGQHIFRLEMLNNDSWEVKAEVPFDVVLEAKEQVAKGKEGGAESAKKPKKGKDEAVRVVRFSKKSGKTKR